MRARAFREAQLAGNLHHPNITTIYEFGVEGIVPFIVQELLSGEDLDRVIGRRDPLPLPEKVRILIAVASALEFAHGTGNRPPGHQAREHPDPGRRGREDHGLRNREVPRLDDEHHERRHRRGLHRLHVARADRGREHGRPHRHLLARRRRLRAPELPQALRARKALPPARADRQVGGDAPPGGRARGSRAARRRRPARDEEDTGGSLRVRGRHEVCARVGAGIAFRRLRPGRRGARGPGGREAPGAGPLRDPGHGARGGIRRPDAARLGPLRDAVRVAVVRGREPHLVQVEARLRGIGPAARGFPRSAGDPQPGRLRGARCHGGSALRFGGLRPGLSRVAILRGRSASDSRRSRGGRARRDGPAAERTCRASRSNRFAPCRGRPWPSSS